MIIPYGYFNKRSWDKNHLTQDEMAIPIIYSLIYRLTTEEEPVNGLKCSNT